MKLSAFADRKADENKVLGRHHALDAYTIVGMMTEAEYERARMLADRSRSEPHFVWVCDVVAAEFSGPTALGMLRLHGMRLTDPILKAMVRSPRIDPSVSRRPHHGPKRWQTA
jgi:hypothetical protein